MDITLQANQAALVLTIDDEGEVSVDVGSPDTKGLSSAICEAIAIKLVNDEEFQEELMDMLDGEEE
jgi:hypothetical protein